jgi:hypothetical protein
MIWSKIHAQMARYLNVVQIIEKSKKQLMNYIYHAGASE